MKIIYAVPLCAALLVACGDESTTQVNEHAGLQTVAAGEKMNPCTKDNEGEMVIVTDSAAVFYCAEGQWTVLNGKDGSAGKKGETGEKGEKGETGAEGKASSGTNCTAEKKEDGSIEVSCGGELVGTLNSAKGFDGKSIFEIAKENGFTGTEEEWLASLKGENCTAEETSAGNIDVSCGGELVVTLPNGKNAFQVAKANGEVETDPFEWVKKLEGESCTIADTTVETTGKTGYKVTCAGEATYIWNGADGATGAGCTIDDSNENGIVKFICGEGENAETVTLRKALCGTKSYDPETHVCDNGTVHEKVSMD